MRIIAVAAQLFPTLAIASILSAAPAAADYRVCMELCTKGRDFAECHGICRGQAGQVGGAPKAAAKPAPVVEAEPIDSCAAKLTYEEKKSLVYDVLMKGLSRRKTRSFSFVSEENSDEFEVAIQVLHYGRPWRQSETTRIVTPLYWTNCVTKGRIEFPSHDGDGECGYEYVDFGKHPQNPPGKYSSCEKDPSAKEYCVIGYMLNRSVCPSRLFQECHKKKTVAGPCPR